MFSRFCVFYVLTRKDPQSCYRTTLFNIELNGWNLFYVANSTNEIVCISNVSIRLMSLVAILTSGQKKEYRGLHFQWKKMFRIHENIAVLTPKHVPLCLWVMFIFAIGKKNVKFWMWMYTEYCRDAKYLWKVHYVQRTLFTLHEQKLLNLRETKWKLFQYLLGLCYWHIDL